MADHSYHSQTLNGAAAAYTTIGVVKSSQQSLLSYDGRTDSSLIISSHITVDSPLIIIQSNTDVEN